jgi:alkylation response protein AidB-like acyl-CoA dehydrogenase
MTVLKQSVIEFGGDETRARALIAALKAALPAIEANAAACDVTGAFPAEDIKSLSHIGLLSAFAERENGGMGFQDRPVRLDCLVRCLRMIGGVSLSLGRIFEGHINAVGLIERYGGAQAQAVLRTALHNGALFGVWNTEPEPGVRLIAQADGWRLSGVKSYATGCDNLDYTLITARLPDGTKQMLAMKLSGDRADATAWRTSGMRATVSGHYDFSGMAVPAEAFVGEPDDYEREPMFTAGAWRFTAVQLGAIEALMRHLRDHLKAMKTDGDPIHRARFARAAAAARTAYLWVREAAAQTELNPKADAAALVQMTRGVVEEAGLHVMEAAQRSIGTRAFFTGSPVSRIMRDLALYLRQPSPDLALDRAAIAWLESDPWGDDPWW